MITKYTEKNQFNSESWQVKISSLLHVFIHKTNNNSYLFELKEWKYFSYKTHLTIASNEFIEIAIIDFFEKAFEYIKQTNKWEIDIQKFESLKFKTITYFNENEKKISGNVFSQEDQIIIKAINYYKEKKYKSVYDILKKEDELLKSNLDIFLMLIESTIKLSSPENDEHFIFYQYADDYLSELYYAINDNKIYLNENQKNKYHQLNDDIRKIPFPDELISDSNLHEMISINKTQNIEEMIEYNQSEKALFEATEQLKIGNLEEAHKILSISNLLFEKNINNLLILAKLSILLKKTEEIPSHIIALISEKESGNLTSKQQIDFNEILINYQNISK